MVVTCEHMRALESAAVAGGQTEEALMEEAGRGLAEAVVSLAPKPAAVVIFAGKGHNAGDAWVAARHWLSAGWTVVVRECYPRESWRPLALEKWRLIEARLGTEIPAAGRLIVVDALLGLGSSPGLRPPLLDACRELNRLRQTRHALVVAVDGPTGVDFDSGAADADAVTADVTATIAVAKIGLLAESALNHVGRLTVVPVPALTPAESADSATALVLTPMTLRPLLPAVRRYDFHKGQAGRVLVVAGSRGFLGAARLSAAAAVQGGAGLVILAVPVEMQDAAAASVCAEVMVRGYRDWNELEDLPADALAVGPGLGRHADAGLVAWLARDGRPAVLDADALNALAVGGEGATPNRTTAARAVLSHPGHLLTPHPGEMQRLLAAWAPSLAGATRGAQASGFSGAFGAAVLLKGARTVVAAPGRPLAHNTTGHPGMASGGMGDVLTGLSAALRAQGVDPHAAGCLGSWLLGRAAELALAGGAASPESLRASLVLDHLGPAFEALRFSNA
jgi:hydroxyethylthiazole kinase-like uncharacterized protein yjeF